MDDLMAASTLVDQLSMAIPTNSNRSRLPPTAASTATATVPQQHDAERDNDSQPNRNQRQPSRRRRQDDPTTSTTTATTNKDDPLKDDNDKEDTKETDTNNHGPTRTTQNMKTSTRAVEENGEEDRDDDDDEKDDNESNHDDDEEEANHKASVMVSPSRTLADTGVFATFGSPSGPNETNHNHNNTTTNNGSKRGPYKRNALIYAEFLDMGRRCGNTYVYCRHCYQVYLDHSQSNNSTTNANDKPTPYICRKRPETCRTHLVACPNYQRYRHEHGIRDVVPGPAVPIPPPSLPVAASTTTPTTTTHRPSRKRPLPELPSITITTTKRPSKPSRTATTTNPPPTTTIGQSVPERLAAVEAWLGAAPTPTTTSTRRTSTTPTITILQRIKYLEANYGLEGTGLKIAQRLEQLENL